MPPKSWSLSQDSYFENLGVKMLINFSVNVSSLYDHTENETQLLLWIKHAATPSYASTLYDIFDQSPPDLFMTLWPTYWTLHPQGSHPCSTQATQWPCQEVPMGQIHQCTTIHTNGCSIYAIQKMGVMSHIQATTAIGP